MYFFETSFKKFTYFVNKYVYCMKVLFFCYTVNIKVKPLKTENFLVTFTSFVICSVILYIVYSRYGGPQTTDHHYRNRDDRPERREESRRKESSSGNSSRHAHSSYDSSKSCKCFS